MVKGGRGCFIALKALEALLGLIIFVARRRGTPGGGGGGKGGVVIADELGCTDEGLAAQLSSADEPVKHVVHEGGGGRGLLKHAVTDVKSVVRCQSVLAV